MAKKEDFRTEAALRSEEVLQAHGLDPFADLRQLGVSLCVLFDPEGNQRSTAIDRKWTVVYLFGIGQFFAVLTTSAGIASQGAPEWLMVILLILDVLSGGLMFLIMYWHRKQDKQRFLDELRDRPNPMVPPDTMDSADQEPYFVVDLQRRKGEHTFALFRDDQAVIVPDKKNRCLLIESRGYRHVIYPQDISLFKPVESGGAIGVDIVYSVDGIEVPLHMYTQSIWNTIKANFMIKPKNTIAWEAGVALST